MSSSRMFMIIDMRSKTEPNAYNPDLKNLLPFIDISPYRSNRMRETDAGCSALALRYGFVERMQNRFCVGILIVAQYLDYAYSFQDMRL